MGCASSRSASHAAHRPRGSQPHEHPQMPHYDIPSPSQKNHRYAQAYYTYVKEPSKPPPPIVRGREANKYCPREYDPYDSPYSRAHYGNGKSRTQVHDQYKPTDGTYRISMRDVSPPRQTKELPRRNASHAHRDVSPLGTSRFEQPFKRPARAYAGKGRGRVAAGATFRDGGIGGWENW